jgi:hypothetical protein
MEALFANFERFEKLSLKGKALLQALALIVYCGLVGIIFWKGNTLFGHVPNYLGPLLFLVLLVVSVLVCALVGLGYPFILFWEKDKPKQAVRLVLYTTYYLAGFVLLLMLILSIR